MKRLVFALLLAPALAFADGAKDEPPAPPPPPAPPVVKPLETPKKPPATTIVDGTKDDKAAGGRQCDVDDVGRIVCKG